MLTSKTIHKFLKEQCQVPVLHVFLAVAFEDALASRIFRPQEMSDSLVSHIFVILLFEFLELLLKFLVEPFAEIAGFV